MRSILWKRLPKLILLFRRKRNCMLAERLTSALDHPRRISHTLRRAARSLDTAEPQLKNTEGKRAQLMGFLLLPVWRGLLVRLWCMPSL
jgi:hypothetical protein